MREKDSIDSYYLSTCENCKSEFSQKSINYILDDLEKDIIRMKEHTNYNNILLEISQYIYNKMIEKYSDSLKKLEKNTR